MWALGVLRLLVLLARMVDETSCGLCYKPTPWMGAGQSSICLHQLVFTPSSSLVLSLHFLLFVTLVHFLCSFLDDTLLCPPIKCDLTHTHTTMRYAARASLVWKVRYPRQCNGLLYQKTLKVCVTSESVVCIMHKYRKEEKDKLTQC